MHEVIQGKGGEDRQVKDSDAATAEHPGHNRVAVPPAVAAPEHSQTGDNTKDDSTGWTEPVVIEGIFQEEADADDEGQDTDAGQPATAQNLLPFPLFTGRFYHGRSDCRFGSRDGFSLRFGFDGNRFYRNIFRFFLDRGGFRWGWSCSRTEAEFEGIEPVRYLRDKFSQSKYLILNIL